MQNITLYRIKLSIHLIFIMSNHGYFSLHSLHRHQNVLYTDPILFYKACLQQYQLKMGGANRYSGARTKRVIKKRPIYPLTMTLIPQARWRIVNNPGKLDSSIVVAKALYHRVLKK